MGDPYILPDKNVNNLPWFVEGSDLDNYLNITAITFFFDKNTVVVLRLHTNRLNEYQILAEKCIIRIIREDLKDAFLKILGLKALQDLEDDIFNVIVNKFIELYCYT